MSRKGFWTDGWLVSSPEEMIISEFSSPSEDGGWVRKPGISNLDPKELPAENMQNLPKVALKSGGAVCFGSEEISLLFGLGHSFSPPQWGSLVSLLYD